MALKESHRDEKHYHDEMIGTLQKRYQRLQDRIDSMYVTNSMGRFAKISLIIKAKDGASNRSKFSIKLKDTRMQMGLSGGGGSDSRTQLGRKVS
jgi:hypothetical protein